MRMIRDNNDHNSEDPDEGRRPASERDQAEILAEEIEDYLADVLACAPPDTQDFESAAPQPRPTLRLVKTDATTTSTDPDCDKPLDPEVFAAAGRAARRRAARVAAGGSAVVVTATVLATWEQPWTVTGPLAVYGTAWLAYLWWNAALRPSIPDVIGSAINGVSTAFAVIATAITAIVRGLANRRDTEPENQPASSAAPSL
ncbi:hypothetical protein IU459_04560 [Nocardia amamiensis]|uniref:Holin n=1 Tax=Nocardia amamiensis TaxID=404578 RepID=A0ABS0CKR4_9NOCA|nr:hypothetical protein [Nocardia amamiensis]MBF6296816.1 hypothetical protein [Nocardia amamiensis]